MSSRRSAPRRRSRAFRAVGRCTSPTSRPSSQRFGPSSSPSLSFSLPCQTLYLFLSFRLSLSLFFLVFLKVKCFNFFSLPQVVCNGPGTCVPICVWAFLFSVRVYSNSRERERERAGRKTAREKREENLYVIECAVPAHQESANDLRGEHRSRRIPFALREATQTYCRSLCGAVETAQGAISQGRVLRAAPVSPCLPGQSGMFLVQ